jgi:hypothetical protein
MWLAGIGNKIWSRRCRDVVDELVTSLGGEENVSAQEYSLVRRAAALTCELERIEIKFALSDEALPNTLDLYGRTSSTLRRLFETLGLERRARNVSEVLSVDEIIRRERQAQREAAP